MPRLLKSFLKSRLEQTLGVENVQHLVLLKKSAKIQLKRVERLFFRKPYFVSNLPSKVFSLAGAHVFFGYYDLPQFDRNEKLLLATAASLINKTPTAKHPLKLGFFDLREQVPGFREFASTTTWCWQQGCRLQWYPSDDSATVLYNAMIEGDYGCIVRDVYSGKLICSCRRPIYEVSHDGRWGLSLNFSRLQRLRPGYGYNVMPDITLNDPKPDNDGIWRVNMTTGEEKLLFSIYDIVQLRSSHRIDVGTHYFNHLSFNPAGDSFMFFHICQMNDGRRFIRMLTSNIDGNDVQILNDSGHSSHYCWKDNNHLLCYSTIGNQEGYYLYDIRNGLNEIVGSGCLTEDGHPSYLPGGHKLITDTYPDQYGESSLLLYDCDKKELIVVDKEFLPVKFSGEIRCDLHPRVSPSGKYVCIDTVEDGKRVMKLLEIENLVK